MEFYVIHVDIDAYIDKQNHDTKFVTKVYKNVIGKFEVDPERVIDFSCSKEATFFIMGPELSKARSIIPEKPDAEGLIHFYKESGSESWRFLS